MPLLKRDTDHLGNHWHNAGTANFSYCVVQNYRMLHIVQWWQRQNVDQGPFIIYDWEKSTSTRRRYLCKARHYLCNVLSHCWRPRSAIDRKRVQVTVSIYRCSFSNCLTIWMNWYVPKVSIKCFRWILIEFSKLMSHAQSFGGKKLVYDVLFGYNTIKDICCIVDARNPVWRSDKKTSLKLIFQNPHSVCEWNVLGIHGVDENKFTIANVVKLYIYIWNAKDDRFFYGSRHCIIWRVCHVDIVYYYALDSVSGALGLIESCQMRYSNSYQFDKFVSRSHRITTRWLNVRVHIKYSWQD